MLKVVVFVLDMVICLIFICGFCIIDVMIYIFVQLY